MQDPGSGAKIAMLVETWRMEIARGKHIRDLVEPQHRDLNPCACKFGADMGWMVGTST
jgi:hypothetical protein